MMSTKLKSISPGKDVHQNWLDVLEEYHVRFMALDPYHDQKLIKALKSCPEWVVEYQNEEAVFFIREEAW